MKRNDCARQEDVIDAVVSGHWPDIDCGLRAHVETCPTCRDVALIAPMLRRDFIDTCPDVPLPSAGQVWWRAAVRARMETAERAARPVTWMHGLAGAGAVGLLVALIGIAWPSLLAYAASASASLVPRASADPLVSSLVTHVLRQAGPLLIVVAVCVLIAPVAVYLATSDE